MAKRDQALERLARRAAQGDRDAAQALLDAIDRSSWRGRTRFAVMRRDEGFESFVPYVVTFEHEAGADPDDVLRQVLSAASDFFATPEGTRLALDRVGAHAVEFGDMLDLLPPEAWMSKGLRLVDTISPDLVVDDHLVVARIRGEVAARDGDEPGRFIQVEYDPEFHGGDYDQVGDFAYLELVGGLHDGNVERRFEEQTGHSRENIIHYSFDEVFVRDSHGEFVPEDELDEDDGA